MSIGYAFSTKDTVSAAVEELATKLAGVGPKAVLYFASPVYDPHTLSAAVQTAFGDAVTIGCTTAGEIVSGHMLKHSIVAMAFGADCVEDIAVEVVERVREENRVPAALANLGKKFGTPMRRMEFEKYVGIILVDGLSGSEERLMDTIGDLTDVRFIGGSAGDDVRFEATYVFVNGRALSDAAVLALIKPSARFDIIKTQSFVPTAKQLVATKVDTATRTVLEFDNMPATKAYAKAVGVEVKDVANSFMQHPLGLMAGDEPFVRSPQQVKGDSIVFYCNVLEGMSLSILDSTDLIADTRKAIEDKEKEFGKIAALLNFNCILRTLELEALGRTEDYGRLFSTIPTVGFSTYGEQLFGHINQTATMLVFGK
ncbi:MAG TPA: FIST N-terminal domain-containing protein [Chloroflexota bacterium]|nr:FIST N-terminal domain-containing protein [Chloroflexota bacterium]